LLRLLSPEIAARLFAAVFPGAPFKNRPEFRVSFTPSLGAGTAKNLFLARGIAAAVSGAGSVRFREILFLGNFEVF
jgi:hypothetical protein